MDTISFSTTLTLIENQLHSFLSIRVEVNHKLCTMYIFMLDKIYEGVIKGP